MLMRKRFHVFTKEQDNLIMRLRSSEQKIEWWNIAQVLNDKYGTDLTLNQCYNRWNCHLKFSSHQYRQSIYDKHSELANTQMLKILSLLQQLGPSFQKISDKLAIPKSRYEIRQSIKKLMVKSMRLAQQTVYSTSITQLSIGRIKQKQFFRLYDLIVRKDKASESGIVQLRTRLIGVIKKMILGQSQQIDQMRIVYRKIAEVRLQWCSQNLVQRKLIKAKYNGHLWSFQDQKQLIRIVQKSPMELKTIVSELKRLRGTHDKFSYYQVNKKIVQFVEEGLSILGIFVDLNQQFQGFKNHLKRKHVADWLCRQQGFKQEIVDLMSLKFGRTSIKTDKDHIQKLLKFINRIVKIQSQQNNTIPLFQALQRQNCLSSLSVKNQQHQFKIQFSSLQHQKPQLTKPETHTKQMLLQNIKMEAILKNRLLEKLKSKKSEHSQIKTQAESTESKLRKLSPWDECYREVKNDQS